MSTTEKVPSGVGYCAWPVAMPSTRTSLPRSKRYRPFDSRRMTITGPKPRLVTLGMVIRKTGRTGVREAERSARSIARVVARRSSFRPSTSRAMIGFSFEVSRASCASRGSRERRLSSARTYRRTRFRSYAIATGTVEPVPALRA
jgi:hypothetical protein